MKVKDLIMELIYCDPEAEVRCLTYENENKDATDFDLNIKDLEDHNKNVILVLDDLNAGKIDEYSPFEELGEKVLDWAKDKDLLHERNAEKQFLKFMEEVFEFRDEWILCLHEFNKCNYGKADDHPEVVEHRGNMKLEMGDIFVTLIILCDQLNLDPIECLDRAYNKIKDRKGKTINGTFVKEGDLK